MENKKIKICSHTMGVWNVWVPGYRCHVVIRDHELTLGTPAELETIALQRAKEFREEFGARRKEYDFQGVQVTDKGRG